MKQSWITSEYPSTIKRHGAAPMAKYRNALAQSQGRFFLTGGGIETTLIFLDGQELPYFAAFHLLKTPSGTESLKK